MAFGFRQVLPSVILITSLACAVIAPAPTKSQTRISFASGSDSGSWSGLSNGSKRFLLNLGRGQMFWVMGRDVYSWRLITPRRLETSCSSSCGSGEGARLPETGDYIIEVFSQSGYVTIGFTAR